MATLTVERPEGVGAGPLPAGRRAGWLAAHPYVGYLVRRLALYVGSLWGAFTVTFLFFRLIPGDPIETFITSLQQAYVYNVEASQEVIDHYRKLFGLEGNLFQQYLHYMQQLLIAHDFGPALLDFPTPAQVIVLRALPWTIGLLGLSAGISWVCGLALGTLVGWRRTARGAQWLTNVAIAFSHVPYYFVALMLLFFLAYRLALLPSSAAYDSYLRPGLSPPFVLSVVHHGLLPAISIVVIAVCNWMIATRMLVVTTLGEDYLTFADAKGLHPRHILAHYALRNCYLPLVTGFAITLGFLFNGNVLVERVFNYPGVGNLLVQAIGILDFDTIQAIVALVIFSVLTANLVIDLLLPVLDPRVKYW
jgi:peptide/nickel transport system permease protein